MNNQIHQKKLLSTAVCCAIFILCLASLSSAKIIVPPLLIIDSQSFSNLPSITNASHWLQDSLSGRSNFMIINPIEPSPQTLGKPSEKYRKMAVENGAEGYILSYIYPFEDRLIVSASGYTTNGIQYFSDGTYTYDLSTISGLSNAVQALGERLIRIQNGEKLPPYREAKTNETIEIYVEGEDTNSLTNETPPVPIRRAEKLDLLALGNLGYYFPTGADLSIIELETVWLRDQFPFGIGFGTELFRLYLNLPGYTNVTGTLLPLKLTIPVWINPRIDRISDFLFSAEWAWYQPGANSGSTNTNSFLDAPINYVDFRLTYFFTPFTSLSAGCTYFYPQNSFNVYIGATVYMGFYKKE